MIEFIFVKLVAANVQKQHTGHLLLHEHC